MLKLGMCFRALEMLVFLCTAFRIRWMLSGTSCCLHKIRWINRGSNSSTSSWGLLIKKSKFSLKPYFSNYFYFLLMC